MSKAKEFLTTNGPEVVNQEGQSVILRGFGLGGWMNMENFITGYPANEEGQREILRQVLGQQKYEFFFDRFLQYFFEEDDVKFVKSLGLNAVRLPVNYRHFEDDMEPFVIKESGFKHLDRVINLCAEQGIYTILDLHATPGYQNQDWHADNPTHKALLWNYKHFQDRTVNLWEVFARRYKDNAWVAGYNLINEPGDPERTVIRPLYDRIIRAIRAIDPDHIIFLDGNRYTIDFEDLGEPWPNIVCDVHDYAAPGFHNGGRYPGETFGRYFDAKVLEETFVKRCSYMQQHKVPAWVGEFGPIYSGKPDIDAMRFQILRDQLDIFKRYRAGWSIWTYKDIGMQGVVYTGPDSTWMKRLQPYLDKKTRLGADGWGGFDTQILDVMEPLEQLMAREFPDYKPFPFGTNWLISRLVRHILISEALLPEFGERFRGISEDEIDRTLQSFQFKNCVKREELARILSEYSAG